MFYHQLRTAVSGGGVEKKSLVRQASIVNMNKVVTFITYGSLIKSKKYDQPNNNQFYSYLKWFQAKKSKKNQPTTEKEEEKRNEKKAPTNDT